MLPAGKALEKAGITSRDPLTVVVDKNLAIAREELAQIAIANFNRAQELIAKLDKKTARQVRMIERIYRRYFDMMQKRGWEIISPKPKLGKLSKLSIALRAYFNLK